MFLISLCSAIGLTTGWFPFVIPWNDSTPTPIDMSYLNVGPAGIRGRIGVENGHFVESKAGQRIRFVAVNLVAAAAFPSHEDADQTAAHLAKLGVNLVRFHHLQNPWAVETGGSIWKKGKTYLELDPVQLDKLDYLFGALKRHGIYSNLNLQTTRSYLPEMGFPKSVLEIPFEMDKRIDKVDRRMIELQKEYAKSLLDRKNIYTGLPYKDDPALAFVEINNENSLVGWPGESTASQFNSLPDPFRNEIRSAWNHWLLKRYGTDGAIEKAWSQGLERLGPSLLTGKNVWSTENQSSGDVKFESPNPNQTHGQTVGEAPSIRVTVHSNAGPNWHVQIHLTGLDLKAGHAYTLKFRARGSSNFGVPVGANLDEPDWHGIGLNDQAQIGTDWKYFAFPFVASDTHPNHNRVGLTLGAIRGTIEIEQLSLCSGIDTGPIVGGKLTDGSVPIPGSGLKPRTDDFMRFLTDAEKAYGDEMRSYLRRELGIKSNLVDTQMAWGGFTSLVRERESEYADNHSYWEHPDFPGKSWDSTNWLIRNTAMVDAVLTRSDGLSELGRFRYEGKPYTISEYNHPAPSDYRVEMMPLLASYAALQDWDGFYLFEYGDYGTGKLNTQINSYFDCGLDPMRAGFLPSAALMFRTGRIAPLPVSKVAVVPLTDAATNSQHPWQSMSYDPWLNRIGVSTQPRMQSTAMAEPPIKVWKGSHGAIFTLETEQTLVVVGHVANQSIELHPLGSPISVAFDFGSFGLGFAAATLTPLKSGNWLLTIGSRAENQDMGWNKERTTLGTNWGHGPVQAEGVPCKLRIKGLPAKSIWALDATGKRVKQIAVTAQDGGTAAQISSEDHTIWYEIGR